MNAFQTKSSSRPCLKPPGSGPPPPGSLGGPASPFLPLFANVVKDRHSSKFAKVSNMLSKVIRPPPLTGVCCTRYAGTGPRRSRGRDRIRTWAPMAGNLRARKTWRPYWWWRDSWRSDAAVGTGCQERERRRGAVSEPRWTGSICSPLMKLTPKGSRSHAEYPKTWQQRR